MNGPRPPLHVATISVHACPLAPPGAWETGGMNVYIRELSRHLSDHGVEVDVFTRLQGPEVQMVSPFLVLMSEKLIFTVSICPAVRQASESAPLQSSGFDAGIGRGVTALRFRAA